jgi:hypothetical protein
VGRQPEDRKKQVRRALPYGTTMDGGSTDSAEMVHE